MDLMAIVNDINLDQVKDRLVQESGFEEHMAQTSTDTYRKFLYLKAKYAGEKLAPPKLADEAWHTHIVFTKDYVQACDELCGEYIHHTPVEEDASAADKQTHQEAWDRTKELFQKEFGMNLEESSMPEMRVAGNCL